MENEKINPEKKEKKYILLRFDYDDQVLALACEVALKLGMSLSALSKLSLFNYCQSLAGEKKNA